MLSPYAPSVNGDRWDLLRRLVEAHRASERRGIRFHVTNLQNPRGEVLIRYPRIGGDQSHVRWPRQDVEALAEVGVRYH
jgi:hypothetical protein